MSGKKKLDGDSYEDESDESSHTTNTQPRRRNLAQTSPRKLPTREGDVSDDEEHIEYEKRKISDNLDARKNEFNLKPAGNAFRSHSELNELELEKYPHKESHKDMREVRIDHQKKPDIYTERKKSKDNMSYAHVGSDSGSEISPERKIGKQDEEIAEEKVPNKLCKKKIYHNKDETDSESNQHYESDSKGKPARKDRVDVENIAQRRFTSKENFDRNMPKYIEESESDSSECTGSEKQIELAGKEVSRLSNRTKSGIRGGEVNRLKSRKENATQSCSESDSDSDNCHSKNVKDQREMRHDSTRKSSKKGLSKEKIGYRELEVKNLSELSDGYEDEKEINSREKAYLKNAPRRKNVISQNARGCESESREQSYTPKVKAKHQENSEEEESYGKSTHKQMESIERNSTKRNELNSHSNRRGREERLGDRNPMEDDVLGYSEEKYPTNREGKSTYTGSDSESEYSGYKREKFKYQQNSDEEESYGKGSRKQTESIERNSTKRNEFDSRSKKRVREERLIGRNPKEDDVLGYSKEKYPTNREGKSTGSESESEYSGYKREKFKHQQNSDEEESYGKGSHKQVESIERNSNKRNEFDSHSNQRAREEHLGGRNTKEEDALGYSKEKYPTNREGKSTYTGSDSESEYSGYKREKFKHQQNSDEESYSKSFHKQMVSIGRNSAKRSELDSHSSQRAKEKHFSGRDPNEDGDSGYSKEKYLTKREIKYTYKGDDLESDYQDFRREKPVKDYDKSGSHSDNPRHIQRDSGSFRDLNNKRKETRQYEDSYDHSRDIHRRSNEMRGEGSEFTRDDWERGKDRHHHMYGMRRDEKGRDAVLVTHDEREGQAARTYKEKEPTYWTRRPVEDDDDTHYQNCRGQNRKPPCDRGDNWDEDNRDHDYRRSQHDKSVMNRNSQRISPLFLVNLLLQKKKPKVSLKSLMKVGIRPRDVSVVIHENSHLFKVVSTDADLDETIYLCPQIDICRAHLNNGCTDKLACRNLHICPRYVQSLCNSLDCVLGHKLRSRHNVDILGDFYLDEFPEPEVLKLLRLSLPHMEIPKHLKVCNDYVSTKCKLSNCVDLHICQGYLLQMKCNTANCQLSHNLLSSHNCEILENVGIDTNESPRDVMKFIKDKYPSIFKQQLPYSSRKSVLEQTGRQQSGGRYVEPTRRVQPGSRSNDNGNRNQGKEFMKTPTKSANSENYQFTDATQELNTVWCDYYQGNTLIPEICYFSVTGKCRYEDEGCKRLHANRHFHWQVKLKGKGWINLRNHQVEALERSYCDPDQDGVAVPHVDRTNCPKEMLNFFGRDNWQAHFTAMVLRNSKNQTLDLRRICSENGSVKCARYLWYFLDQNNVWVQYGNIDTTNRGFLASDVTSEDIEKQYLRIPNGSITFKNSMFTYMLDFKLMTQTNTSTKVTRKVRRRPLPHLKAKSTWSFNFFNQS